jgi:hypothetical protein
MRLVTRADVIKVLYRKMVNAYLAWARVDYPLHNFKSADAIMFNPYYLNRLGAFRDLEWRDYCRARDEYLAEVAHQEKVALQLEERAARESKDGDGPRAG